MPSRVIQPTSAAAPIARTMAIQSMLVLVRRTVGGATRIDSGVDSSRVCVISNEAPDAKCKRPTPVNGERCYQTVSREQGAGSADFAGRKWNHNREDLRGEIEARFLVLG